MFTFARFQVKMSKKLLVSAFIGGFATIGALAWAAQSIVFVQPTSGTPIPWPLDGSNIPKVDCVTGCGGGGAGTVTEVDTSGGVTGGPITTTGTLTLTNLAATSHQWLDSVVSGSFHKSQPAFTDISGTTVVTQGGTGATTLGANGVVLGEGSAPVHVTSAGTAGDVLTSNGAGVDPTFQAASGGGDTITSPGSTITVGGTSTNTTVDVALPVPTAGVTGQVLNAVTASSPVWGSVVVGPDAVGGSGGNGADVTIQSGAADGAGIDGVIRLDAACFNDCSGIIIGSTVNNIFGNSITGDNAASGSNNAGLSVLFGGGRGDGTGGGGVARLIGGTAGDVSSNGGDVNLNGGFNNGSSGSASATLQGAQTGNAGGGFTIAAGSVFGGDGNGGNVSITAGNSSGTGSGGAFTLNAGNGGATGPGGGINLTTGQGGGTLSSGAFNIKTADSADATGDITLATGIPGTNFNSGNINISTANVSGTTTTVGQISITTGNGGTTNGGFPYITIKAGTTNGNNAASGGGVVLQSGSGIAATDSDGGYLKLTVGSHDGTGHDGSLEIANAAGSNGTTHVQVNGGVPTLGSGATDCGTSPSVNGNDTVGKITVGSGLNGSKCTVTFKQAWQDDTGNPIDAACLVQDMTTANLIRPIDPGPGPGTTQIAFTGTLVAGDVLVYHCLGIM